MKQHRLAAGTCRVGREARQDAIAAEQPGHDVHNRGELNDLLEHFALIDEIEDALVGALRFEEADSAIAFASVELIDSGANARQQISRDEIAHNGNAIALDSGGNPCGIESHRCLLNDRLILQTAWRIQTMSEDISARAGRTRYRRPAPEFPDLCGAIGESR